MPTETLSAREAEILQALGRGESSRQMAERFGLIGALGQWVTDEACRQLRIWQDLGLGMHVAINLSVHQLRQSDFIETLDYILAETGCLSYLA